MRAALLSLALWLALATAHAGDPCEEKRPTTQAVERGLQLAERTARALDASGAQVVLLARAGQDLSKYHLRYSHFGWAYKTPEGAWRVVHKLNQCGTSKSFIYRQGLGEFFLDNPARYEAAIAIPTAAVQQQLLTLLQEGGRIKLVHQPRYSMVSYAWGTRYQQSNQWALETLAVAMMPANIQTRQQAQAWLQFMGYTPSALNIRPLARLGGRMTRAHIAFDDHPSAKRFANRIETITVDSVLAWMQRAQLAGAPQVVR